MLQYLLQHLIIPCGMRFHYMKVEVVSISTSVEIIVQTYGSSMFLQRNILDSTGQDFLKSVVGNAQHGF